MDLYRDRRQTTEAENIFGGQTLAHHPALGVALDGITQIKKLQHVSNRGKMMDTDDASMVKLWYYVISRGRLITLMAFITLARLSHRAKTKRVGVSSLV